MDKDKRKKQWDTILDVARESVLRKAQEPSSPDSSPVQRYVSPLVSAMTDEDQKAYEQNTSGWKSAHSAGDQAGMDYWHAQQERLRNKYGYSGGESGGEYVPLSPFSYKGAQGQLDRQQEQINALMEQVMNRQPFQYNPAADPAFQQYAKQYRREGARTTEDTMARAAAMTGGIPSSYAVSAAQQAGNLYNARLGDKIPELRQLAYNMYMDEGNEMRKNLSYLTGKNNADRAFAYNAYRDEEADRNRAEALKYAHGRDDIADQRYAEEQATKQALAKAQMLAAAGDFSGFKQLGYTDEEIAKLQSGYTARQASKSSGGSRSGGGSRGSGGGSGSGSGGSMDYDGLFKTAQESGHPKSFIANNYKSFGFSKSTGLYDDYAGWEENGGYESGGGAAGGGDNYNAVRSDCDRLAAAGAPRGEIMGVLRSAYSDGVLTLEQYRELQSLYNRDRW